LRPRTNQPAGWVTSRHGHSIRYDFRDHDYIYYPHSWTDADGVEHDEGYYDENGVHYRNVCAANTQTMLTCEFCGTKSLWEWKEGTIPGCSSCGAQIKIDKIDAAVGKNRGSGMASRKPLFIMLFIYLGVTIGMPLIYLSFLLPMFAFSSIKSITNNNHREQTSANRTVITTRAMPSSVFVKEINRTCYLDGDDYYDKETDCWFWFNTDIKPGQWQYWYEGISSDFGDYGWMEYDDDESLWYIETSEGNWIKLPEKYDTSKLWHFEDMYANDLY
jgi:hypothetical protein